MAEVFKGSKYESVVRTPDGSALSQDGFLTQARSIWAQQVSEARALLNQLQTASPEEQIGIHEGVRAFIAEIRRPLRANADISAITSAITSHLDKSLSALETQEHISPALRSNTGIYFMGYSPRVAAIFMERYGLPDGLPKSVAELSKKYQLTKSAITQNAFRAGRLVLRDSSVSPLIRASFQ